MIEVFFVSAGLLRPKKAEHPFARRHYYLNYGLLRLCTLLVGSGVSCRLWHGNFEPPGQIVDKLLADGLADSRWPLHLSLPSFFAIPWAQEFCALLKKRLPKLPIVAGGRWVVDGNEEWLSAIIPQIDDVRSGLGETYIASLTRPSSFPDSFQFIPLAFDLVGDFALYQPSIEVARGCGMGCAFCVEAASPLSLLPSAVSVVSAVQDAKAKYANEMVRPYFEASVFMPSAKWASDLAESFSANALSVEWRCETRVDAILPRTLEALRNAGLRVIDLGLESASRTQLSAMTKSVDNDRYLERASRILHACRDLGIWAKVNLLLYPGETANTIAETKQWLDAHSSCIKGVSVGPVILYGTQSQVASELERLRFYGARPVDAQSAQETGITRLHLSDEISADHSDKLSVELAKRYMTERDYFDLKSFSYFARNYSYRDFCSDLRTCDISSLPFRESPNDLGANYADI